MIEKILPDVVATSVAYADDPDAVLAPEEEAAVERAVATRRAEFTTGRACAREALRRLGSPTGAIPVGEKRAPVWPHGVVGAITHCAGLRAAAVAWVSEVRSLGIDAEPHVTLPDGVLDAVTLEGERAVVADLMRREPDVHWDKLLFSAKESIYKTWFPLTGLWLGFEDAEVTPALDGTFAARLLVPGPVVDGRQVGEFAGRWRVDEGILATAITLLAHS